MTKSQKRIWLTALILVCLAATSTAKAQTSATGQCRVVPFSQIERAVGPLQAPPVARFEPYGSNPRAGWWVCGAYSSSAVLTVMAGCHLPNVGVWFAEYSTGTGRTKGDTWQKISGLGDQAELIISANRGTGGQTGVVVKRGGIIVVVTGKVGDPANPASSRPMPASKVLAVARGTLHFRCP